MTKKLDSAIACAAARTHSPVRCRASEPTGQQEHQTVATVGGRMAPALLATFLLCVGQALFDPAQAVRAQETSESVTEAVRDAAVNINTAGVEELTAGLSGVGASKAEAILRYREQFGPFESIEELTEVQGIGPATLERNRTKLRVE